MCPDWRDAYRRIHSDTIAHCHVTYARGDTNPRADPDSHSDNPFDTGADGCDNSSDCYAFSLP